MGSDARTALHLALCLLVVAALMKGTERFAAPPPRAHAGPDGGLSILAASRGPLLPPARLPGGEETLDDAILIGDLNLELEGREGLRVASLAPGLAFDELVCFDLARSEADAARFPGFCRSRPVGALLVLAGYGRIAPATAATRSHADELAGTLAELGAEAEPLAGPPASWALITARRPRGWVRLAEARSTEQGVTVAFTVDADLATYDDYRGELFESELSGEAALPLQLELGAAQTTEGVRRQRWTTLGGETRDAIWAPPPARTGDGRPQPSRIRWRGVRPTAGAVLRTGIGLTAGAREGSGGATFALLADGEVLHSETLEPGSADRWHDWEVPLGELAGREVELELRVDPDGDPERDWAVWGGPALVQRAAPERPPEPRLFRWIVSAMLPRPDGGAAGRGPGTAEER